MNTLVKNQHAALPLLSALFPILFLLAQNIEQTAFSRVIVPIIIVLIVSFVLYIVLALILRNMGKAALIVSFFTIVFFSFGHLQSILEQIVIGGIDVGRDRYILIGLSVIFFAVSMVIVKTKKDISRVIRFFMIALSALVAMSLIQIAVFVITVYRIPQSDNRTVPVMSRGVPDDSLLPDIYYIILDGYANARTLEYVYNFDNSEFLAQLGNRGFFVASKSRSNYAQTHLSLASSLNMKYINDLGERVGATSEDRTETYKLIKDNEVSRFLKLNGYRFVHVSSGSTEMTDKNEFADLDFRSSKFDEFTTTVLEVSALYPFIRQVIEADARKRILYSFEALSKIPSLRGPKFVFAHILIPHPPYVFGPNGEPLENPQIKIDGDNYWRFKEHYLNQLLFANKKTLAVVDNILSGSRVPPIIILQGDHGTASTGKGEKGFEDVSELFIKERMKIFNAYFLPGYKGIISRSITPVNSFRIIFNYYFGTKFELLPDKIYFSLYSTPYLFRDVTEIADQDF